MVGNKTLAQSTVDSDNSINTKLSANTKQSASEDNTKKDGMQSYVERKEQMKAINRTKKAIAATEKKIESMEIRLKELDDLLCDPKNASDMTMVNEYTDIKRNIDVEIEKWEKLLWVLSKWSRRNPTKALVLDILVCFITILCTIVNLHLVAK